MSVHVERTLSFTLDVVSHLIGSSPESFHIQPWSSSWRTLFDSFLPFYFYLFLPVFSFYFLHSELCSELDNPIVMESLCYSANKETEDAYDVSTTLTDKKGNRKKKVHKRRVQKKKYKKRRVQKSKKKCTNKKAFKQKSTQRMA